MGPPYQMTEELLQLVISISERQGKIKPSVFNCIDTYAQKSPPLGRGGLWKIKTI
jgi:hypothetical protein